jgi:hypothetical protein
MMAFKYECSNSENTAAGTRGFHKKGNGKPRAKKCSYCGSAFYVEEGQWGVFVWDGRGDYRREDAVKLFESPKKAEELAYSDTGVEDNYCVRWVYSNQV